MIAAKAAPTGSLSPIVYRVPFVVAHNPAMAHARCPVSSAFDAHAPSAITFENVSKIYPGAQRCALDQVTLSVPQGSIFGLLGPNGAGKTTLLSMLTGRLRPEGGTVAIAGRPVGRQTLELLGVTPQEEAVYPTLTARENLEFFGRLHGLSGARLKERVDWCLTMGDLHDQADHRVETFSGGYVRRLNLVVALIHEPQILVLDEPTVAIDPHSRSFIHDRLRELYKRGVTILISTHYMDEAEQLCHAVAILLDGRVIAQGPVDDLLSRYRSRAVMVELASEPGAELLARLSHLPGVTDFCNLGRCMRLTSTAPHELAPRILAVMHDAGITPNALTFGEASFEEAFLSITRGDAP